jgi:hypothetical protein
VIIASPAPASLHTEEHPSPIAGGQAASQRARADRWERYPGIGPGSVRVYNAKLHGERDALDYEEDSKNG